jgi:hypothetical protein
MLGEDRERERERERESRERMELPNIRSTDYVEQELKTDRSRET